jgi:hypothetical protein
MGISTRSIPSKRIRPSTIRNQTHDGLGGDALAAPGLPDHAEDFAFLHVKGDVVHRPYHALEDIKIGLEVLDIEEMFFHAPRLSGEF